jgi:hypothetical protein
MFCPNCGQQQISDEMRFCSRCGLALSGLAEWLGGGGVPAKRGEQALLASPRRKAMRRAGKVMFGSAVLFPIFFVISLIFDEAGPMFVPIAVFFVSLVMMLYARLFSDKTAPVGHQTAQTTALGSTSARGSLGAQQVRTNELIQPPSVTDHTTKLLDNE